MKFHSTRSDNTVTSKEALLMGISPDKGLFVPENFPKLGSPSNMTHMQYEDLCYYVLGKYLTDFTPEELKESVHTAYQKFSTPNVVQINRTSKAYFLELYHGETAAFKDLALSLLPELLKCALASSEDPRKICLLTATSGDTGKATLESFKDQKNFKVIVLYPKDGVSGIQKLQMMTQEGDNVHVLPINGNFDECQSAVKTLFRDDSLETGNYRLSSANSINIGRLLPQIVYYIYTYVTLLKYGEITKDETINFVVPTGNFGNILASYYAKQMGLPIGKVICASNENDVLTRFFNTGKYDGTGELLKTNSPSMDILISSNLERYLYHELGSSEDILTIYEEFEDHRSFELDLDRFNKDQWIKAYSASDGEGDQKIVNSFIDDKYLIDPHTAIALACYNKYLLDSKDFTKTVICSTASPYKFADTILHAFNIDVPTDMEKIRTLHKISEVPIPKNITKLFYLESRFHNSFEQQEIKNTIEEIFHEEN
ncbi:MAG: threonine synthase [Tissierellia bacterium]|nr:threonine synthase [Tissierellia bacterium]